MIKVNYRSDSYKLAAEVECVLPGFRYPMQIHVGRRSLSYGDPIAGLEKATVNWPTAVAPTVEGAIEFAAAVSWAVVIAREFDGSYRKYRVTLKLKDGQERVVKALANNKYQIYWQFQASGFEVVELLEVEEGS